jgi:hypothetical protein
MWVFANLSEAGVQVPKALFAAISRRLGMTSAPCVVRISFEANKTPVLAAFIDRLFAEGAEQDSLRVALALGYSRRRVNRRCARLVAR